MEAQTSNEAKMKAKEDRKKESRKQSSLKQAQMKRDLKKYCATHYFAAADLKTRVYWVNRRKLVPGSYEDKPVEQWHSYYAELVRFGLTKEDLELSKTYIADMGDGKEVPTGIGEEPVSDSETVGDMQQRDTQGSPGKDTEENADAIAEAKADEGKPTEANLSDAGSSDDADISQPPTPKKKSPKKLTVDVSTPKNIVVGDMPPVGPDGNPITPKYPAAKYADEKSVTSETSEDKAILAMPDAPPTVPRLGRKQRGYIQQQYEQASATIDVALAKIAVQAKKIKLYKEKLGRRDATIAGLEQEKEKVKGLETKVRSQGIRISQLETDNGNMLSEVTSLKADMEKKVRKERELMKQLEDSKSRVSRLEADMKDQTKGMGLADMDEEEISDLGVRGAQELKKAMTVREQIFAGMPEHRAIAKENVDLRQEIKDVQDELKILREKDKAAVRNIYALEKERDELRQDIANAGSNIGPEAKSYQRLLEDFERQQERNEQLKKDIKAREETKVYQDYLTAKSNYVILRRLCYMTPNKCAMLLHNFTTLVERAYAKRMEDFLKFIPGITYLEKMRLVRGHTYVIETIKAVYKTWGKYSLLSSPEDGRFQAFDVLPELDEKPSTHDIAERFLAEIAKLKPMGIEPDSPIGKETTLKKFLRLLATDPQFKGNMDEYSAGQEERGEYPTAEHMLLAEAVSKEHGIKVTPKDIMAAQGLNIENMQKPYTGMTKAQRKRLRKTHGDGRAAVTPVGAGRKRAHSAAMQPKEAGESRKRAHSADIQPKKRTKPAEEVSISEESEAVDSTAEA